MNLASIGDALLRQATSMEIPPPDLRAPAAAPSPALSDAASRMANVSVEAVVTALRRMPAGTVGAGYLLELDAPGFERPLEASSARALEPGTRLVIRFIDQERARVEQVLERPKPLVSPASSQALREALPRQQPVAEAYAGIARLLQQGALPPEMRRHIERLLQSLPLPETISSGSGLRQALENSGSFLESRLLRAPLPDAQARTAAAPASAPPALPRSSGESVVPPNAGAGSVTAAATAPGMQQSADPGNALMRLFRIFAPVRLTAQSAPTHALTTTPPGAVTSPGVPSGSGYPVLPRGYDARGLPATQRTLPVTPLAPGTVPEPDAAPSSNQTSTAGSRVLPVEPVMSKPAAPEGFQGSIAWKALPASPITVAPYTAQPTRMTAPDGAAPQSPTRSAAVPAHTPPTHPATGLPEPEVSHSTTVRGSTVAATSNGTGQAQTSAAAVYSGPSAATPPPAAHLASASETTVPASLSGSATAAAVAPSPTTPPGISPATPQPADHVETRSASRVEAPLSGSVSQTRQTEMLATALEPRTAAGFPGRSRLVTGGVEAFAPAGSNMTSLALQTRVPAPAAGPADPNRSAERLTPAGMAAAQVPSPDGLEDLPANRSAPTQPPLTANPGQRHQPVPLTADPELRGATRETGRTAGSGIPETTPGVPTRVTAEGIRTHDSRDQARAITRGERPLETRRREGAPSPLRSDLKATLSALLGLLNQSLAPLPSSGMHRPASAMEPLTGGDPGPPLLYTARGFVEAVVDPQEGSPRGRRPHATHGQRSAEIDAMTQLLRYVEGALARTRVHQLSSLPELRSAPEGTSTAPAWVMEFPIPAPKGFDSLWMRLEDQGPSGRKSDAASRRWQVMLCLDCAELGPLHAQVELSGNRLGATLWAEREGTLQAARAAIGELEEALRTQGVEVSRVDCRHGRPPESTGLRFGNLLDVRT